MSEILSSMINWSTNNLPTSTILTSINPTHSAGLLSTLSSAYEVVATETNPASLRSAAQNIWGAKASLSIILAEEVLATATNSLELAKATEAIYNGTLTLIALANDENLYGTNLNEGANLFYTVIFGLIFITFIILTIWSKYLYFGLSFTLGSSTEFLGYLARAIAVEGAENNENYFLIQFICLTIAPAFIMAGVYYTLAQVIVHHGREYSILKPTWFTYIFVFCDVTSLLIQAIGGGMAATALKNGTETINGTHVMVAGISFQVVSMTLFLALLFDFIRKHLFNADKNIKFSIKSLFAVVFNTHRGNLIRCNLQKHYNPKFFDVRSRKLYSYTLLVIFLSSMFIYIRCIYRVVELAQGWTGFLITHEVYVLTLDAMMVFFTCSMFIPFHLAFTFGKENRISFGAIRRKRDTEHAIDNRPMSDLEKIEDSIRTLSIIMST